MELTADPGILGASEGSLLTDSGILHSLRCSACHQQPGKWREGSVSTNILFWDRQRWNGGGGGGVLEGGLLVSVSVLAWGE